MDIEGFDYPVLESADFTVSRPKVICVEARFHETDKFRDLLCGYTWAARLYMNLVFVHNDYFYDRIFK